MAVPPSRLVKTLETARANNAQVAILDTAPHSEGTALDAARASDLILVPCQPSIMDLRAMRKTADILNYLKKPTFAVLNEVSPVGTVADEAAKAITAQFGIPVAPVRLGQRVAFSRCLLTGQTAQEYRAQRQGGARRLLPCSTGSVRQWDWRIVRMCESGLGDIPASQRAAKEVEV